MSVYLSFSLYFATPVKSVSGVGQNMAIVYAQIVGKQSNNTRRVWKLVLKLTMYQEPRKVLKMAPENPRLVNKKVNVSQ